MIYIDHRRTDPAFNLALEEYVFERMPRDRAYFMTWQNDRTVVVGRYQNAYEEVNREFAEAHGIRVVRRISGGGAVYHDLGNLNYTVIVDHAKDAEFDFGPFASVVVDALRQWDIPAELTGRNDIAIRGAKVSGSAQYVRNGRLLHHGCILVDSDLECASAALRPNPEKYRSRGVKSVRSRITTVNAHAPCHISVEQLRSALQQRMAEKFPLEPYRLTEEDIRAVEEIRAAKYATEKWNWGSSPAYSLRRETRCAAGVVTAEITVEDHTIRQVRFSGDFFGRDDLTELEGHLCGNPPDERLKSVIDRLDVDRFIKGLSADVLYRLLTGQPWDGSS